MREGCVCNVCNIMRSICIIVKPAGAFFPCFCQTCYPSFFLLQHTTGFISLSQWEISHTQHNTCRNSLPVTAQKKKVWTGLCVSMSSCETNYVTPRFRIRVIHQSMAREIKICSHYPLLSYHHHHYHHRHSLGRSNYQPFCFFFGFQYVA